MANENKTNENKTVKNFVKLEGWLKDNTLAVMTTNNQKSAISGQLVIATSATEEFRIRLFAAETFTSGQKNPNYEGLLKLLSSETVTVKTILEANEGATFEAATLQASKVWATGNFSVYDRKDEGGEIHTSVTLQGNRAGFKIDGPLTKKKFAPEASFDCEGFLNKIQDEKDGETETGRVKLEILIPDYFHETVMPVEFIVPAEIRDVTLGAWNRGETVSFKGHLVNARKEVAPQRAARTSLLGHTEVLEPTFVFVNERVITEPFPAYVPEDVKAISADTVKTYLANREKMLEELEVVPQGGTDNRTPLATASTPTSAPASAPANPAAKYGGFQL